MESRKCCLCLNLRTGAFILGYTHLVLEFCVLIFYIAFFGMYVAYLSGLESQPWPETAYAYVLGANIFIAGISIGFIIILIYGLHKDISKHIRSYLVFNIIFFIYHVVDFFFSLLFGTRAYHDFVVDVLSILLTAYFLLVIRSYWLELRAQDAGSKQPTQVVVHSSPPDNYSVPVIYVESMEKPPLY